MLPTLNLGHCIVSENISFIGEERWKKRKASSHLDLATPKSSNVIYTVLEGDLSTSVVPSEESVNEAKQSDCEPIM